MNTITGAVDRPVPKNVKVVQATYSLLKNLGNYENERVELTAKVYDGECPNDVSVELKRQAMDILSVLSRLKTARKPNTDQWLDSI